jgi:O-antigen/teichoic acid export membrane protein
MDFGIANVVAITVIVYIIGLAVKATKLDNKWIPVICGAAGVILGIVALLAGMPDFPASDYLTAAAVGGASGLAATGFDQIVKQMKE